MNDTSVIINNDTSSDNITVVVNENVPHFDEINKLFGVAISLYQNKLDSAVNNIIANSALYLNPEEVAEVNLIQTLTGKWIETATEMDTIQQSFSAGWQQTTEFIQARVVDAGYF